MHNIVVIVCYYAFVDVILKFIDFKIEDGFSIFYFKYLEVMYIVLNYQYR